MNHILLPFLIILVVVLLVYLYYTNEHFGSSDWVGQWRALYAPRYVMVLDNNKMQPVY